MSRDDILNFMEHVEVDAIVRAVAQWALKREDILALALVGSWARGDPRQGSDVDLVLLSDRADEYRHRQEWIAEIEFESAGYRVASSENAIYGVVWSWHIGFVQNGAAELTFAPCSWARADIIDAGTRRVVKDALRIIFDKAGLLANLVAVVMSE